MKRLVITLAALFVAAGAAFAGLYLSLSPRYLAAEVERSVAAATGRTLVMSQAPRLSLWPEVAVTFNGIRLANPPAGGEDAFAEADQLKLKMNVAALFQRRADVAQVRLVRPRFSLTVDAQGRANWSMPDGRAPKEDLASPPREPVPIFVEDGTLEFRDERSGRTETFANLDLTLKLASLGGPVEVAGHGDWQGERVQLALFIKSPGELAAVGSPLDLNLSMSRLTLAFNGQGAVRNGLELAGRIEVKASSLGAIAGLADAGWLQASGPVEARGALTLRKNALALKQATIIFAGVRGEGDLTMDLAQAAPRLSARLGIDRLDLTRLLPIRARPAEGAGEGVDAWSNAPIDFSGLKTIGGTATLKVGELICAGLSARDVNIEATLAGGVLDAKLRDMDLLEGRASGQLVLNGARDAPTVQASFQGKGLDGRRLLKGLTAQEVIDATAEIAVAVASQGQTESEMVASLRGSAGLSFANGSVRGLDVAAIVQGLAKGAVSGWQERPGARTDFSLLKASFAVGDGVAESNDLQLLGPLVRMSGAGSVDLLRREVDFRLEPRLVNAGDPENGPVAPAGLGVPVIVKGPWAKPTIAPETTQ